MPRKNRAPADGRASFASLRLFSSFAAAMLTVAALGSAPTVNAQSAGTGRFKPFNHTPLTQPHRRPLSLLGKEHVNVVVTLSAESVAQFRERAVDHLISAADHSAIESQVAQQHRAVEPTIVSRGGRILARYHDALNGIKINIARSEVAGLAGIPGVVSVVPVRKYTFNNTISVPFIGAPLVWQGTPGYRGEHVKVAVLDTGIDYTHADFGGPGTVAAFNAAAATSTQPADPGLFGPNAPKVKGGTDLVGDAYDADDPTSVPVPDPNPLDCNGHGSHVSGTAAGFGVALDGSTYHGPYNQAAYTPGFLIGPGVAPLADLYAVRVFGCTGSTNVVTDAIDWAVHNNMDVISMSLGSPYGNGVSSDDMAAEAATKAGVVVVAAAGNNGPGLYLASAPSTATDAISVAAIDSNVNLVDGVIIKLSSGLTVSGVDENALPLPSGTVPAVILTSGGTLSLGCNASDYPPGGAAGAIVIIARGTCSFDQKSANAMAAGAAALGVVNNAPGFFSPLLTATTIPFIALSQSDGPALAAAAQPATAMVAFGDVPDTGYRQAATFSTGGPRSDDGALKPNVSAPGFAVFSVAVGTGTGGVSESGTSMATPHVAGVAALAIQAHKAWGQPGIRSAVVQTADPTQLTDYTPRIEGGGLVQAVGATATNVTVSTTDKAGLGVLSFGVAELSKDFHGDQLLLVQNHSRTQASFNVSSNRIGGVPHTVGFSSSTLTVPGLSTATLRVSLTVPASTVGATHDSSGNALFEEAAGYVSLRPATSASNNGVSLTLPYYLVPRARSNVGASLRNPRSPSVHLDNRNGVVAGNGDFYAWGLQNQKTGTIDTRFEPRAIGVQSNVSGNDSVVVFAVNTYGRFANIASGEYDIYIDVNGDGTPDFVLFSADVGTVEAGSASGQPGTFLVNLSTNALVPEFPVDAPTDGSIALLPVLASDLGIKRTSPRLTYQVIAFDDTGASEEVPGTASFNVFNSAVSNAMFVSVPPNTTADVPVSVNLAESRKTPALGVMVVTEDNMSGPPQANLLALPRN